MKLFFIVIIIDHFILKYIQSFIYSIQRSNQISCKMLQNNKQFNNSKYCNSNICNNNFKIK